MPRRPCYWTRKLELELVDYVRQRDFIWKPIGNTNHHIQQKYKAYAEFAAKLGHGFTARSVRDRWVNIRSTFNHNLRRVDRSRETAMTTADVYVPCWPLWRPMQFLRDVTKKENGLEGYPSLSSNVNDITQCPDVKEEMSQFDPLDSLKIRQRGRRTDRPRRKSEIYPKSKKNSKCKRIIDDLVTAMQPLVSGTSQQDQNYWFFGRHVTERLNCMRQEDADCASRDILMLLDGVT